MSIQCSHILQKHSGSRRPFDSFRNKPVTRSLNEARQNINSILSQVKENPKSFAELALKYSECSSAARGGDLG